MQSFVLRVCKSQEMLNDFDDPHWHAFGPARRLSKRISASDVLHATR